MIRLICAFTIIACLTACGGQKNEDTDTEATMKPVMVADGDSLYQYVADQVAFGPRTPGSEGHQACRGYITRKLTEFGADTILIQEAPVRTYLNENFTAYNIMGQFNPEAKHRILLLAHYDTRPWATEDPDERMRNKPIPGANDGGSGVAVLLETARNLGLNRPDSLGIDLLFVDVEDSGQSETWGAAEETWCLGTQQWVKDMPYDNTNRPEFGILVDMVGGKDARFHREFFSQQEAKPYLDKVWAIADASGYASRFPNDIGGAAVDDHVYINRAGIPCINIIENAHPTTDSFNPNWHTMGDDIGAIDSKTMRMVTQVILNTVYSL